MGAGRRAAPRPSRRPSTGLLDELFGRAARPEPAPELERLLGPADDEAADEQQRAAMLDDLLSPPDELEPASPLEPVGPSSAASGTSAAQATAGDGPSAPVPAAPASSLEPEPAPTIEPEPAPAPAFEPGPDSAVPDLGVDGAGIDWALCRPRTMSPEPSRSRTARGAKIEPELPAHDGPAAPPAGDWSW